MRRIVIVLVALASCALGVARDAAVGGNDAPGDGPARPVADLIEMLDAFRADCGFPALAAAVVRDGQVVARGVVGYRKFGDLTKVAPDDAFHLGSCTKAMTAMLAAILVEEGRLRWDTTLGEAFPDLRDTMAPEYRAVTLDHLLAHRSGLPHETWPKGKNYDDILNLPGSRRDQRAQYVAMILRQAPEYVPGTKYVYSNAGYTTIGAIIERVTDRSWEDLMRERIFGPLGMTTAGFGPMGRVGHVEQPWPHRLTGGKTVPVEPGPRSDNPPAIAPSGGVHCSIGDWVRFVMAYFPGANAGPRLLKEETLERLLAPRFGGTYAGGWVVTSEDWASGPVLAHDGSNTMNYTFVLALPEPRFAALVATNRGEENGVTLDACKRLVGQLIGQYHSGLSESVSDPRSGCPCRPRCACSG